jgi:hypothetical protein
VTSLLLLRGTGTVVAKPVDQRLPASSEAIGARAVEAAELRSLDVSGDGEADAYRKRHQVRGHVDPQLMGNLASVLDNTWLAWHNHVHRKTRFAGKQRHRIQRGQAGMSCVVCQCRARARHAITMRNQAFGTC